MGDDDGGAIPSDGLYGFLDLLFGKGIERGRGFIQEQASEDVSGLTSNVVSWGSIGSAVRSSVG